jgi:C4-dicarboxylate-specific signal transduction histidine kinase
VRGSPRKWIRISAVDRPGVVAILVEDSGAGIPAGLDEDVFRSFFTTKPIGAGTGLGLSISRSIIESHGGTLTLDRGAPSTRFVVELPR